MNFQQLRMVREAVRRKFNLTEVGNALLTSPSGVSRHIKDLEEELGVVLFTRHGKRLTGLTPPGEELLGMVERLLNEAANIKRLSDHFSQRDEGRLTIATTHTQARYVLPRVVREFRASFPRVQLKLHQGSPAEIAQLLLDGEADLAVATESLAEVPGLASFPYYRWRHSVIAPVNHPLTHAPLSLQSLAEYPLITYHEGFTGRAHIDRAFAEAGLFPQVAMSALDADVIKTYVALGMGVGIVASMALDAERDSGFTVLPESQLFAENVARIAVCKGRYLRRFAYRFIAGCDPSLDEASILRAALASED